jgi:chromosomal replication initiator protein
MNSQQAWQATVGQLQMEMSKASFDTWVRSAELLSYQDDNFTVGVPNAYARDWL